LRLIQRSRPEPPLSIFIVRKASIICAPSRPTSPFYLGYPPSSFKAPDVIEVCRKRFLPKRPLRHQKKSWEPLIIFCISLSHAPSWVHAHPFFDFSLEKEPPLHHHGPRSARTPEYLPTPFSSPDFFLLIVFSDKPLFSHNPEQNFNALFRAHCRAKTRLKGGRTAPRNLFFFPLKFSLGLSELLRSPPLAENTFYKMATPFTLYARLSLPWPLLVFFSVSDPPFLDLQLFESPLPLEALALSAPG